MNEITTTLSILLVDDYPLIDYSMGNFLRDQGYKVFYAADTQDAMNIYQYNKIDIIITDIKMPNEDGLTFIEKIRNLNSDNDIIVITGHGDMDVAVQSIRLNVTDFLMKPVDLELLLKAIERTRSYQDSFPPLSTEPVNNTLNERRKADHSGLERIIGNSKNITEIKSMIRKVQRFPETSVLIEGESGTGKELIARAIHYESANADRPFVPVNTSSIPETLIESELFGHEKGSFTDAKTTRKGLFEMANSGTIFLDEIGDISLPVQKNLLRVLENREIRYVGGNQIIKLKLRVVAATNKNLEEEVKRGEFRQDLFYRLNIFRIYVPPLRERKDDIVRLAEYFLSEYNRKLEKDIKGMTRETLNEMVEYPFPGNIRELRNFIEQAVILCDEDFLQPKHFPIITRKETQKPLLRYDDLNLDNIERDVISRALKLADFNKARACRLLGITRDSLRRKLEKYSINVARNLEREEFL